jgi:signal transduction histidine kinase
MFVSRLPLQRRDFDEPQAQDSQSEGELKSRGMVGFYLIVVRRVPGDDRRLRSQAVENASIFMERQISHSPFLAAFADYIHQQRFVINRQWMLLVRESPDVPDALHISEAALQDHVPELLGDLVERLREEKKGSQETTSDHSRSHGREQWKAGYNISELIWEIYIIKRVLRQSVLVEFARLHPEYPAEDCVEAESVISDFFHRLMCDSVGQFIKEQQRVVREKNEALEQTNQARERLTRMVSHELRNVLNALTLTTTMLGEEATAQERHEMSAICARMLADMSTILNDLLDFSALVAGRARLTLERLSLPRLFEEITAQWRPVAREQGMKFTCRCDASLGEIVSDKLKLARIAGNLLSNAIKYRKPERSGDISVVFSADGLAGWKLAVADTGIGIAREDLKSLFGEFNRIRPNSAVEGTGLGLAICKEYAQLLGGRIDVFSEAEQGTRFEVRLPLSAEVTTFGQAILSPVLGSDSPSSPALPPAPLPAPEMLAA